jgi:hypothetical protein
MISNTEFFIAWFIIGLLGLIIVMFLAYKTSDITMIDISTIKKELTIGHVLTFILFAFASPFIWFIIFLYILAIFGYGIKKVLDIRIVDIFKRKK